MNAEDIRLLDGDFYAGDPYPIYAWLRENAPVHWDAQQGIWGISRFADVVSVEKNTQRYSSASGSRPRTTPDTSMINTDDPHHNARRRLVSARFTPRAVARHEAVVRAFVTELIDAIAARGACEVVEDLAAPLPAMVINEWLGFPREMWPQCKRWSELTMLAGGQHGADGNMAFGVVPNVVEVVGEFAEEVVKLAHQRRQQPRDDLISIWANAESEGRKLDDGEIIAEALLVLDGGAETTRSVIATTVLNLLEFPDEHRKLVQDPSPASLRVAVEEFIRWVTPILNMRRTATETHSLHGCTIREGDEMLLMYASANRDPAHFEAADRYDVRRQPNQHVAFGFGTHFCLGASLARLELRVTFEELLRRLPDMRRVPGTESRFIPSCFTRAPDAVHVEFASAT